MKKVLPVFYFIYIYSSIYQARNTPVTLNVLLHLQRNTCSSNLSSRSIWLCNAATYIFFLIQLVGSKRRRICRFRLLQRESWIPYIFLPQPRISSFSQSLTESRVTANWPELGTEAQVGATKVRTSTRTISGGRKWVYKPRRGQLIGLLTDLCPWSWEPPRRRDFIGFHSHLINRPATWPPPASWPSAHQPRYPFPRRPYIQRLLGKLASLAGPGD